MDRLSDIFSVKEGDTLEKLCEVFMKPIFQKGRIYEDVIPVLEELKRRGFTLGLISNTPRGSPSRLWKKELERYGLEYFDDCVFCVDVGWRKPDVRIFKYALDRLGVKAEECLFIGDDPRWDVGGPEALGIRSLLIDRRVKGDAINGLYELINKLTKFENN
jgi:putative hydrolase of the HAD superfamily